MVLESILTSVSTLWVIELLQRDHFLTNSPKSQISASYNNLWRRDNSKFDNVDLGHCKCKNWSFCCIWQDWLDVKLLGLPNARSSPSCNYQKLFVLSISKDILGLDHTIAIIEWACLLCLAYSCFFWLRSFMLLMITIIFPMCIGLLPTWWWAIRKGATQ